jgi:Ca-activated chloride channel family protein
VLASERAKAKDTVRAILTWSHPELHPMLITNALGAAMPAPEGDVTLGIAQARLPVKSGTYVEVKVEKDEAESAARLGAEALLTVVFDELGKNEKIVRLPVKFERGGNNVIRFTISEREVTRD